MDVNIKVNLNLREFVITELVIKTLGCLMSIGAIIRYFTSGHPELPKVPIILTKSSFQLSLKTAHSRCLRSVIPHKQYPTCCRTLSTVAQENPVPFNFFQSN